MPGGGPFDQDDCLALDIAELLQALPKRVEKRAGIHAKNADKRQLGGRLCECGARPCRERKRDTGEDRSPPHSITTSARPSTVGGIARPSALAVLRLITGSYLAGAPINFPVLMSAAIQAAP